VLENGGDIHIIAVDSNEKYSSSSSSLSFSFFGFIFS
jgi:hypothetical protein